MAVASYSLATPYRNYPEDQRVAVVTSGAFIGTSTGRVGPRPARPVRPAGVGLLADLRTALDLDDLPEPPMPTSTTPTRAAGRKTSILRRRLDLAERLIG